MINTKFVVVDAIYNFVIDKFFIWSHLEFQMFILSSHFEIQIFDIFQTILDIDMTYTKVVVLGKI